MKPQHSVSQVARALAKLIGLQATAVAAANDDDDDGILVHGSGGLRRKLVITQHIQSFSLQTSQCYLKPSISISVILRENGSQIVGLNDQLHSLVLSETYTYLQTIAISVIQAYSGTYNAMKIYVHLLSDKTKLAKALKMKNVNL